jgi:hypothetical protein
VAEYLAGFAAADRPDITDPEEAPITDAEADRLVACGVRAYRPAP